MDAWSPAFWTPRLLCLVRLVGDIVSVLGAIAGSLVGGLFGDHSAKKQQQRAAELSLQNWKYEQKHAHQFEVGDLRAAGLNPILSATGGQIAGNMTPSGSDTSGLSSLGHVITSAMQADMHNKIENGKLENDRLRIENDKNRIQLEAMKVGSEVKLNEVLGLKSAKEADLLVANLNKVKVDTELAKKLNAAQVAMMKGQEVQAYAIAGQAGAMAHKAMVDAGVSEKQSQILTRELTYGAIAGRYLGAEALEQLSKDPFGYLSKKVSGLGKSFVGAFGSGVVSGINEKYKDVNYGKTGD